MDTDKSTKSILSLALDRIVADPALQPRVGGLDADHIELLQENPGAWPPLVVVDKGGFLLVDGFHRFAAAQALELAYLPVEVREPPADGDLRALAFALNIVHGKLLTKPDRRAEAERLFRANPRISSQHVSEHAGISPTTAEGYRQALIKAGAIEATDQRVSRAGVTYTPPSPRQPGELPPDEEPLGAFLTSKERREQRRLVRYFERLATALDDGFAFDNWQSASDGAAACSAVLGDGAAEQLGQDLGPAASNVLDLAIALGYEDDES